MAMLHNMHNGLIAVSLEGNVNSINRAAEKILNTTAESVGKPVNLLLSGLDLENVLKNGDASIGIKHSQGDLSLLCNINPIIVRDKLTGANIVFQDLTDLNRLVSELESVTEHYETLQSVMDIAYDGIIVVDESSRISMINKAAAKFFRKHEEDIVGRPAKDVIENTRLNKVVRSGVPEINELQFIGGTPYVVSSQPIFRKGQIIGAVGKIMFRNLAEIQDMADKLANIDQQLAYYKSRASMPNEDIISFDQIVTADTAFKQIKEDAEIAARGTSTILITGQSGTGKELVAQSIHNASLCCEGPLVKVNCAAIPEALLESEFFGYAPGAFTGASRSGSKGKLAAADGGTFFLDEIGDMPFFLQGKLLRALQDSCFEPIGSNKSVYVNVRFIAATNHDLKALVQKGLFRPDLYYRLNVIHFSIPPLKERRHDIILLVHTFLDKYNRIFGTNIKGITSQVQSAFLDHEWPGNVRELENVIERAINFARGDKIEIKDLPLYLREGKHDEISLPGQTVTGSLGNNDQIRYQNPQILRTSRENHERQAIVAALGQAKGNKAAAARALGISRSWLYEKMSKLSIK
jgi:transcriptional regulator with PAS, ATPase and Fis domain